MKIKTAWKDWETVEEALDEIVLVRFQFKNGRVHVEDAEIIFDRETGGFDYILFDGESYNISVTPIQWMRIPD